MSTIDPKILAKIKKCLALSASSNPHEAAAALRQAKALMRQHDIDVSALSMSEIGESKISSRTMARDKPNLWESNLISLVGQAFGCKIVIERSLLKAGVRGHVNEVEFRFIGQTRQVEIASYTATVLVRKCKDARQKWIAEHLRGLSGMAPGSKAKVTALGNAFAMGWVHSIAKVVADFANPPEVDQSIQAYIEKLEISSKECPVRSVPRDKTTITAAQMGMLAAQGESIYRPMGAQNAPLAIVRSA
jgi:hypothetical protein